jgi:outer membrane protein TolC
MLLLAGVSAGIGIVLLVSRSSAQPAPAEANASRDVSKLQEERLATLREAAKFAAELYARGVGSLDQVNRCNQLLLDAELESAAGKQRIEILQNAVTSAKRAEEMATQQYQAGMTTQLAALEAKAYRLRLEIELAKEVARQ